MSFGILQVATIKVVITFKLESKIFDFDLTNPRALFGIGYILGPFISKFASISDASIKLNELIFLEGHYS